jgi:hypothetical protein
VTHVLEFFDFFPVTQKREETSWILENQRTGDMVASREGLSRDTYTEFEQCIPEDCYKLTLIDSFGDG